MGERAQHLAYLRFKVWGLGSRVWSLRFGVLSLKILVWGLGIWGLGFGVWGLGFGVRDLADQGCVCGESAARIADEEIRKSQEEEIDNAPLRLGQIRKAGALKLAGREL